MSDKLSDDDDMTRQRNKIYAQGNALIRKFYMCTENVKIALFKSYCTTLYTSTMWCKYRRESLRQLCVAYNNIFFVNSLTKLGIVVQARCLSRDNYRLVKC